MRICPRCSELFQDDAGFCPFDGLPLTKAADPLLGRTIAGRFRLIKRLGAGGMSSVYLARHVMIDRLSAIKILRQDLSLNPSHRERFLREARAVNRINHRNIVEITDFGDMDDLAYLVMEYVEGDSLQTHLRRGRFSWERAARVAAQMSAALARAHQMSVIHRDLKPENVMIVQTPDYPDLVKLTDFGIAKILDAPALTFSEQMIGTPGYIAPDYLEGLTPDGRADLYALGVVLYEMISGVLPYDAKGQSELLFKPLHVPPIPLSQRLTGVPPDVETLVLELLSKKRGDRPADAFVVHDRLVDILRRRAGVTGPSLIPGPDREARKSVMPPSSAPESVLEPVMTVTEDDVTVTVNLDAAALDRAARISEAAPPTTPKRPSSEAPSGVTVQLGRQEASALSVRWNAALEALEVSIARALSAGGERAHRALLAKEHSERVRQLIGSVEKGSARVAEYQGRVDRLAMEARECRADLGRAIDELSHERSRERLHLASIRARREELEGAPSSTPDSTWESETLRTEEERSLHVEADYGVQIEALQRQLDSQNERFDREFAEATGLLEGAISAVRRLTHELVRALDEAASLVTSRA